MKKWLIALFIALIVAIACIYIFIPGDIKIARIEKITANADGILRTLLNDDKWRHWWPGNIPSRADGISVGKSYLIFHDHKYRITKNMLNGFEIVIQDSLSSINSILTFLSITKDTTQAEWRCEVAAGLNPIARLHQFGAAREVAKNMNAILEAMKVFMESKMNVYNMNVEETKVTDTFLISINTVFVHYPSTTEIYSLFNKLDHYARQGGAEKTNPFMLHVEKIHSNEYKTIVAVPINKILPDKGEITFKRMVPGNIVVGEVKGGVEAVQKGFRQLDYYMQDYEKSSPAIQFESLITDRLKEPDSSKWITRLYYPVY